MRIAGRLAAVTVLLALLPGCGDGGGGAMPTPAPTPTGAPSATAAPTPSPTPADASFPIAAPADAAGGVGVAWGAGHWLVAFAGPGARGGPDAYGVRLERAGVPADGEPLLLSALGPSPFLLPATASYVMPAVAFDGVRFGVFFFGDGIVGEDGPFGQIVGFTSVPASGDGTLGATALAEQATFSQARTSLGPPVVASGAQGRFVELHRRHFTLVGSFSFSDLPGNFVEVVDDGGLDVRETGAVSVELAPPDDDMVLDTTAAGVAFGAGRTLAAWVEVYRAADGGAAARLQGAWIAPETPPVRVPLAATKLGSQGVAVASDGARFLVVWIAAASDGASALTEVRGLHFTPDAEGGGTVDPPGGFVIVGGDAARTLGGVAFGGGSYLVAWLEDDAVRGAHVAPGGVPGSPFTIDAGPASGVGVASDGERFLAAFVRAAGGGPAAVRGIFVPAAD